MRGKLKEEDEHERSTHFPFPNIPITSLRSRDPPRHTATRPKHLAGRSHRTISHSNTGRNNENIRDDLVLGDKNSRQKDKIGNYNTIQVIIETMSAIDGIGDN